MYQFIGFIMAVVAEGLVVNTYFGCSTEEGEVWNCKQVNYSLLLNASCVEVSRVWHILGQ